MKGIKECVNWMLDHEHAIITDGVRKGFYSTYSFWLVNRQDTDADEIKDLSIFDTGEWEEVKTPYTFEEAYKLCKEEGVEFVTDWKTDRYQCEQYMTRNLSGHVKVEDAEKRPVILDVDCFRK